MNITSETRLMDLLEQYPWLKEEALKISDRFKIVDTPIGRMMLKNATIADISKKAGIPEDEIISKITALIEAHDGDQ